MKKTIYRDIFSLSRYIMLALLLTGGMPGIAQDFPTYGKVTQEELRMKECAFDKEAGAVVLIDEAVSSYNNEYNLITERHIRLKILKEKSIEYGNVSIPFYREDGFEFISNIEGLVINGDGLGQPVIQNLEKKAIYSRNISNRVGEVTFAFPSVKAGSIIEYRYRSTMKHYGGLRDWDFQREIPVVLSKYLLYVVPRAEFTYQVRRDERYPIKVNLEKNDGRVSFEMQNIPALEEEPYMDARQDYLQRVLFQLSAFNSSFGGKQKTMTTWDEVAKELMNTQELGGQLTKDLPGTDDFIKLVKLNSSFFEKMNLVLNYVRTNMSWNGIDSKYSMDGVKSAWQKKKGTSGDINLILVNLLKAAGLDAYPMLVSERHHGKVRTDYPFLDQFNTVYAAVLADGKKYFLDGTNPLTPPHIIPYNILNTVAIVLNRKTGTIVMATDENLQYHDIISVMANVGEGETISGNAFISSSGYARIRRLERYSRNNTKYIDENFKQRASTVIDSFEVLNQETDSLALQTKLKFSAPLEGTGDYKFVPINMFSGFEHNPFLSNKRFSDINFSFKRYILYTTVINIPNNYIVDAIPKSIQLTDPEQSIVFSRELAKDANNKILCRIKIDFRKSHYTVDEYDNIKAFYQKMFDLLNEQIVLKKKS